MTAADDGDATGEDHLARWLADARADEEVAARSRVRRLVRQEEEEGTLVGALLDLSERAIPVRVETAAGRAFHGLIAGVGHDFAMLRSDAATVLLPLRAVAAIAPVGDTVLPAPGTRHAAAARSLAAALHDACAEGLDIRLLVEGRDEAISGTLVAVGADVLTLLTAGPSRRTTYVTVASVAGVLLPSG